MKDEKTITLQWEPIRTDWIISMPRRHTGMSPTLRLKKKSKEKGPSDCQVDVDRDRYRLSSHAKGRWLTSEEQRMTRKPSEQLENAIVAMAKGHRRPHRAPVPVLLLSDMPAVRMPRVMWNMECHLTLFAGVRQDYLLGHPGSTRLTCLVSVRSGRAHSVGRMHRPFVTDIASARNAWPLPLSSLRPCLSVRCAGLAEWRPLCACQCQPIGRSRRGRRRFFLLNRPAAIVFPLPPSPHPDLISHYN